MSSVYVLHEAASGYALFECVQFEEVRYLTLLEEAWLHPMIEKTNN